MKEFDNKNAESLDRENFIKIYKKVSKLIVASGDLVDFEIHIKNLVSKSLYNIKVVEEVPPFIDIVQGTLDVNGTMLESYNLSRGIKLETLDYNEEVIIKYKAIINQADKDITTKLKYTYEVFNGSKKELLQGEVISDRIKVQNVKLEVDKFVKEEKILLGDEIELIITIKNIGEVSCYNINIKEELCENLELIEGSFKCNEKIFNIANILKGVNIGILDPKEEVCIKYKVKIIKVSSNGILKSLFNANFEYLLKESSLIESKELRELELKIKVNNPIMTEFINEYLIDIEKESIKEIVYMHNELEVIDFYIINTAKGINLDNINFRGRNLLIIGKNKSFIQYLLDGDEEVYMFKNENIFVKTISLYETKFNERIVKVVGNINNISSLVTSKGIIIRDFIFLEGLIQEF